MADLRKQDGVAAGQQPAADNPTVSDLLARLDDLLGAFWPAAVSGDVKSGELVRRVVALQADMLGKVTPAAADDGDDELAKLRARRDSA